MSFGRGFWSVRVFGGWSIFEGCLVVLCFCGLLVWRGLFGCHVAGWR